MLDAGDPPKGKMLKACEGMCITTEVCTAQGMIFSMGRGEGAGRIENGLEERLHRQCVSELGFGRLNRNV